MSTHEELRTAQRIAADTLTDGLWACLRASPDNAALLVSEAVDRAVGALHGAGYRLVSEDPETVERVAKALWAADNRPSQIPTGPLPASPGQRSPWSGMGGYESKARAAIAALKGNNDA